MVVVNDMIARGLSESTEFRGGISALLDFEKMAGRYRDYLDRDRIEGYLWGLVVRLIIIQEYSGGEEEIPIDMVHAKERYANDLTQVPAVYLTHIGSTLIHWLYPCMNKPAKNGGRRG
jgi:hypothetical protein